MAAWPFARERSPVLLCLFCSACSAFKALIAQTIQPLPTGIACYIVTGECTDCHNMLQATASHTELPEVFAASFNTPRDSSDALNGEISGRIGRNGASIPPETRSSNLRWLYHYRVFLASSSELKVDTIDEHLRSLSRMSHFFANKPFEKVTIQDVINFKNELRRLLKVENCEGLSRSTVLHILDRCEAFFQCFKRQPSVGIDGDLPGYFNSSRHERTSASGMAKEISLTFDEALRIFQNMPSTSAVELRNKAIVAMFIVTGMRISALISLRGRHVNIHTRWINQDPREVHTKGDKHIRTYCLDLGHGLLSVLADWAKWRELNGFGIDAPFFLPDRFIQPNCIGLGYRSKSVEAAQCWTSEDPVQKVIKDAAEAAGIPRDQVSSHDFRKIIHAFLSKHGGMMIHEEVALQLNLGHTPVETIRRHYASMQESEREVILDELCRRAASFRSEIELYLAYERNMISEAEPDYRRAKDIFERYSKSTGLSASV
jgi:integrase